MKNDKWLPYFLNQMEEGRLYYENGKLYKRVVRCRWGDRVLDNPKELKKYKSSEYITVSTYLKVGNEHKNIKIYSHRLIYAYFHGLESIEGLTINHIDGNKINNNIENLEAVTQSENVKHAFRNNLKNNDTIKKLFESDKHKIEQLLNGGFSKRKIAKMFGVSHTVVNRFCKIHIEGVNIYG